MSSATYRDGARLRQLGPWDNRGNVIDLGPDGLVDAWAGRLYSVQRYRVAGRPGWDRLHVQRNDGRNVIPWRDLQAIKGLLPDGDRRLAVEVFPAGDRVVDHANAFHLWVLPLDHPLELELDRAEELGQPTRRRAA